MKKERDPPPRGDRALFLDQGPGHHGPPRRPNRRYDYIQRKTIIRSDPPINQRGSKLG